MNAHVPWPDWLTSDQVDRLKNMAQTLRFSWIVVNEAAEPSASVWGQWARGLENEINVALRQDSRSLVGIYPRGQGFWQGGREPAMVMPETSATATVDEALDLAVAWATERKPGQ